MITIDLSAFRTLLASSTIPEKEKKLTALAYSAATSGAEANDQAQKVCIDFAAIDAAKSMPTESRGSRTKNSSLERNLGRAKF